MHVITITGAISKDRMAALGKLCIHWSILENRIEALIWALRSVPRKAGRKITSDMQLQPRLRELEKTAKLYLSDQSDIDTVKTYSKAIRALAKDRNWYVHGLWGHGTAKGDKRRVFATSYFKRQGGESREASVQNIQHVIEQSIILINTIDTFIIKRLGVPLP